MLKLFTYGTLQQKEVQENIYGRIIIGAPERLVGYVLKNIQIEEEFGIVDYPIIVETQNETDYIEGIVYEISEIEMNQTDLYEGIHYKRIEVELHSKQKAWVYSSVETSY